MKTIFILLVLSLPIAAYGQEPTAALSAPVAGAAQPDTSGERLKQLLHSADELKRAGKSQQAATVRRKAEQERQSLLAHLDSLQAEIERIQHAAGDSPQVMVHLKVFEVSLTKLRRLGYNLAKLQGKRVTTSDGAIPGFSMLNDDGGDAAAFFESLRQDDLAKVLAEPSLMTISGTKATFNSGGKIRLPRRQKDGSMPLEWQQYGTQVELIPHIRGDNTVRLSIHFELSSLDYAHGVQVGKDTFPGIDSLVAETTSDFRDGQTVVLGGLNQVHVETSNSGVPIASSIPYIGSAFKTVKEERNETAMFLVVRPEVVQPIRAADDASPTAQQPTDNDVRR